jgi:hypothetical protein
VSQGEFLAERGPDLGLDLDPHVRIGALVALDDGLQRLLASAGTRGVEKRPHRDRGLGQGRRRRRDEGRDGQRGESRSGHRFLRVGFRFGRSFAGDWSSGPK